jgi:hypothetical protein
MPSDTECLIICESVHNLQNLKPYTSRLDIWEYSNENTDEYEEGGNFYYKSLDGYAFYAVTGGDGLVYIYLGKGGTGGGSPMPEGAIQIGVLAAKGRMTSFDYENPYLNIQKLTNEHFENMK